MRVDNFNKNCSHNIFNMNKKKNYKTSSKEFQRWNHPLIQYLFKHCGITQLSVVCSIDCLRCIAMNYTSLTRNRPGCCSSSCNMTHHTEWKPQWMQSWSSNFNFRRAQWVISSQLYFSPCFKHNTADPKGFTGEWWEETEYMNLQTKTNAVSQRTPRVTLPYTEEYREVLKWAI